jgi:serine/threonine-protein kinase
MSPEQARGLPLDYRTDLWSLAAVSYEMLTGEAPFAAPNVLATLRRLELGEFEPPSALLAVPAPELDQVFARALAPHVDDRFATGGEFAQALGQAVGRFVERGGEPSPPELGRVLGRGDDTATMGSAVISRPAEGRRGSRTRALLFGIGALGVVSVIALTLATKPPAPASGSRGSLVSLSTDPTGQPSHSSEASSSDVVASRASSAPAASSAAPTRTRPRPAGSAARGPRPTDRSSTTPHTATDPVFGLEVPSAL